jgi:uncharacterized membrane protein YccC
MTIEACPHGELRHDCEMCDLLEEVDRLRSELAATWEYCNSIVDKRDAEIERQSVRLRALIEPRATIETLENNLAAMQKALRLAAGMLSTHPAHSSKHPEEVLQIIIKAAKEEK